MLILAPSLASPQEIGPESPIEQTDEWATEGENEGKHEGPDQGPVAGSDPDADKDTNADPEVPSSVAPSDPDAALRAFDWNLDNDLLLDGGDLEWPEWDTLDTSSAPAEFSRATSSAAGPDETGATESLDAENSDTETRGTEALDEQDATYSAAPPGASTTAPAEDSAPEADPPTDTPGVYDDAQADAEEGSDRDIAKNAEDHADENAETDTDADQDIVQDDDDIYTAWIKATRRTRASTAEPSSPNPEPTDTAADQADSSDRAPAGAVEDYATSAPPGEAAIVHSSDENATKGNDPNSSAPHAGAMLETITALSQEVEALEARLRAAGVPFRRVTGDLARALPFHAQG